MISAWAMLPVGEGPMHIRTIIVTAIASLTLTGTSLGDWGAELTASGGVFGDQFGQSVALDGDTCVIGAEGTNSDTGIAYVYGSTSGQTGVVGDLDGDGDVDTDIDDLLNVVEGWGITCH
jgi:hypothetical protein